MRHAEKKGTEQMTYYWYRTPDHPSANDSDPQDGAVSWNVDFESDRDPGKHFRIHVGPETRARMLKQLSDKETKRHDSPPK